ncbi:hypothetical protein KFK09_007249 [Dendrobium nobile]|uniref:Uncharacterized protein n=1 Tax=Dendrobium nobile TaxID=94219 RepID=A0A8T3BRK8_DENNO|nr:hypothetical protein KFK09_007249 [Dendrobium nobile]
MAAFVARNDLHDMGIMGPKFTWCNNKRGNARILEILDRCLLNSKTLNEVQNAVEKLYQSKMLRYEDVWDSFPAAKGIVLKAWNKPVKGNGMEIVNVKCKRTLKALHFRSKQKLKNFKEFNIRLKSEIGGLQVEEANAALPVFLAANTIIPKRILNDIDKAARNIIWDRQGGHGLQYINMFKSWKEGGIGLKSMIALTGPLRAKFAWNFLKEEDSSLNKAMKARYGSKFWENANRPIKSATWKILAQGALALRPIMRWKIAAGNKLLEFSENGVSYVRCSPLPVIDLKNLRSSQKDKEVKTEKNPILKIAFGLGPIGNMNSYHKVFTK